MAIGSPANQPGSCRLSRGKRFACSRASSRKRIGRALIFGSTASMRDEAASTISSGETSRRRNFATASVAVRRHRLVIASPIGRQGRDSPQQRSTLRNYASLQASPAETRRKASLPQDVSDDFPTLLNRELLD